MGEYADDEIDRAITYYERPFPLASRPVRYAAPRNPRKVACPICGRHVKAEGLANHARAKHSPTTEAHE